MRLALSSTISATFTWREACSSKVEATTSAFELRAISVTSSGRSSISSTMMYTSGWLSAMALMIDCMSTVLPVLGWATISARWPLPMGEKRSTMRVDMLLWPLPVRQNFSLGNSGVMNSNCTRSRMYSGARPLISFTRTSGKYFSPSFGGRIAPFTVSPGFSPKSLICEGET